jgi:hypothetical protein
MAVVRCFDGDDSRDGSGGAVMKVATAVRRGGSDENGGW